MGPRFFAALFLIVAAGCASTKAPMPCSTPFLGKALPEIVSASAPVSSSSISEQALSPAELFVSHLKDRRFSDAASLLDSRMAESLPARELERIWNSLERRSGRFQDATLAEIVPRLSKHDYWFLCRLERQSWKMEIVVDGTGRISGLLLSPVAAAWQAPDYAVRSSFEEIEVSVGDPALAGHMAVPKDKSDFAVVLVHGSGPQDEDASSGVLGTGSKIFKDLAWGLASKGVTVIRYPKRTWAFPEQFAATAFDLDDEVTNDACAASRAIAHGIPRNRVFLLGHSLGGAMAPRIVASCPGFGGMILLAGPSRSLDEVLFDQFLYLQQIGAESREDRVAEMQELMSGFAFSYLSSGSDGETLSFSGMRAPRSYWADLSHYNPRAAMTAVHLPVLVLQGERDYQVTRPDFEGWRKLLARRRNASFRLYPALDHRFIAGEGAPGPRDFDREGHLANEVIGDMVAWIQKQAMR